MSTTDKVRQHRKRLREQGLRPFQIWVPDTRSPAFAAKVRKQVRRLQDDAAEQDILDFTDKAAQSTEGWQ